MIDLDDHYEDYDMPYIAEDYDVWSDKLAKELASYGKSNGYMGGKERWDINSYTEERLLELYHMDEMSPTTAAEYLTQDIEGED